MEGALKIQVSFSIAFFSVNKPLSRLISDFLLYVSHIFFSLLSNSPFNKL